MAEHDAYEQRIWKVSKALDRLAILCEQHHYQTQHRDGLPDWTPPTSAPAGVPSEKHVNVPTYFAWRKGVDQDDYEIHNGAMQRDANVKEAQVMEAQPIENAMRPTKGVENDDVNPVGMISAIKDDLTMDTDKTTSLPPFDAQFAKSAVHTVDNMARTSPVVNDDTSIDTDNARPAQPFQEVLDYEAKWKAKKAEELRSQTQKYLAKLVNSEPIVATNSNESGPTPLSQAQGSVDVPMINPNQPAEVNKTEVTSDQAERDHVGSSSWINDSPAHLEALPSNSLQPKLRKEVRFSLPDNQISRVPESSEDRSESVARSWQPPQIHQSGYRTAYSDANRWIDLFPHPPRSIAPKERELYRVPRSNQPYLTKPVFTGTEALHVAEESSREFLGKELKLVKESQKAVANQEAASAAQVGQDERLLANTTVGIAGQSDFAQAAQINANEAAKRSIEDHQKVMIEEETQTDAPAIEPIKFSERVHRRKVKEIPKVPESNCVRGCSVCKCRTPTSVKSKLTTEKSKKPIRAKIPRRECCNPILMNPRYPPEPMFFRAKSKYMTDFKKPSVKALA